MQRLHQSYLLRLLGFVSHLEWPCLLPISKTYENMPCLFFQHFLKSLIHLDFILKVMSWGIRNEISVLFFFFPSWLLNQDALVAGNRITTSDWNNRGLLFDIIRILEVGSFRLDEAGWSWMSLSDFPGFPVMIPRWLFYPTAPHISVQNRKDGDRLLTFNRPQFGHMITSQPIVGNTMEWPWVVQNNPSFSPQTWACLHGT